MKKTIIALALLSSNVAFSTCNTVTQTWDESNQANRWNNVNSYHVYNITNSTPVDQTYQVCYELVTQMFNHTHVYRTNECTNVILKSGQATGDVPHHLNVQVNYPQMGDYYNTAIDADTVIRGECQAHTHVIKRLRVSW